MKMTEHPILFNTDMVRAVLKGRKTQTRRVVKPQPVLERTWWRWRPRKNWDINAEHINASMSPYGVPGESRLWVRETWAAFIPMGEKKYYRTGVFRYEPIPGYGTSKREVVYRADSQDVTQYHLQNATAPWRPSIHMPRWACRTLLDVTAVRCERLQDMSKEDAIAEGASPVTPGNLTACSLSPYVYGFHLLWDSINAKRGYSWDSNPWVWVVEFKLADAKEGDA